MKLLFRSALIGAILVYFNADAFGGRRGGSWEPQQRNGWGDPGSNRWSRMSHAGKQPFGSQAITSSTTTTQSSTSPSPTVTPEPGTSPPITPGPVTSPPITSGPVTSPPITSDPETPDTRIGSREDEEAGEDRDNLDGVIQTPSGLLRGLRMSTISSREFSGYYGIPYAQPPVGQLRFRDAVPSLPWPGVLDASTPPPFCIQLDGVNDMSVLGQEDCLYLNVFTPSTTGSRPVMVYIHGGSFFFGTGSQNGPAYLLDREIVLVTINYRLGPFGFLSTGDDASPGNGGLKDQNLALRWIQANIRSFGGNPDSVTIFGQSSGGAAVQHHIVSQSSRGLFHRAIAESGNGDCFWAVNNLGRDLSRRAGEKFNCPTGSRQLVECLRNVDANELVQMSLEFQPFPELAIDLFAPVVEHNHPGAFLTARTPELYRQGRGANVPLITGLVKYEMAWLWAALQGAPDLIDDINNRWDSQGERFLFLQNKTDNPSQVALRVRDYYLGPNARLTFENRNGVSQMLGDRLLLECAIEGMRDHSRYTGAPVYGYEFSYEGQYSIVQHYGQNPREWGVAHLDDLLYLFNNTDYYDSTINIYDEEFRMSQLMIDLWSNFATYGIPYRSNGNNVENIWQPIERSSNDNSPLRFLDLTLNPRMINDPYVDRYNFWRGLNLRY